MHGIPVIDLFAGPGGLGEGFSSFTHSRRNPFRIVLSVEKDPVAHRTLTLRAFFRQFDGKVPEDYYRYLRKEITRDELFSNHPQQACRAQEEALCAELGGKAFNEDFFDERIRKALNGNKTWLLIGGPPCQAYSLAGRSRRVNDADFEKDPKHVLYREYLRILAVHNPPVFIMENVKGILSSEYKNGPIFKRILRDLASPADTLKTGKRTLGYRILSLVRPGVPDDSDYIICAEKYGIPQSRHRVILLGVRNDIDGDPGVIAESDEAVSLMDAIGDLPVLTGSLSGKRIGKEAFADAIRQLKDYPFFRKDMNPELNGNIRDALNRLPKEPVTGEEFMKTASGRRMSFFVRDNLHDARLGGVINHSARSHMKKDLHRYIYMAAFAEVKHKSPVMADFPDELLPAHKNVEEAVRGEKFADRFRVQVWNRYATTITSHIAKDGHYFVHPDPAQCRSLTVREAARIQTFPDNYFFEGPRTEQYKQVGNAVPPLLARQIAEKVYGIFRKL